MSEINAIATNNYLLAAQQEVSHDNTLSGNGTVDSPLGLNETVLYSSSGVRLSAETSLSEPGFNFEKIEFYWCGSNGVGQGNESQMHNTIVAPCTSTTFMNPAGWNNVYWHWARLSANSDYSKIIMDSGKSLNFGSRTATATTPTATTGVPDSFYCYKIVGINRKAQ